MCNKLLISLGLLGSVFSTSYAYRPVNAGSWSVSIVPTIGINLSVPQKVDIRKYSETPVTAEFTNTARHYFGLGIQGRYLDDMQLTLKIATTGFSGGYEYATDAGQHSNDFYRSNSAGNELGALDLTAEKRLVKVPLLKSGYALSRADINVSWGIRYVWIPRSQRTDTTDIINTASVSGTIEIDGYYYNHRYSGGALKAGMNIQFYIKQHRSLKLSAVYTHMPGNFIDYRLDISYLGVLTEQAVYNVSRHQVLLYLEYPVNVYRNKASKKKPY